MRCSKSKIFCKENSIARLCKTAQAFAKHTCTYLYSCRLHSSCGKCPTQHSPPTVGTQLMGELSFTVRLLLLLLLAKRLKAPSLLLLLVLLPPAIKDNRNSLQVECRECKFESQVLILLFFFLFSSSSSSHSENGNGIGTVLCVASGRRQSAVR